MAGTSDHGGVVLRCAAASRFLLLSLILFWRNLVIPYDTSAPLNPSCLSSANSVAGVRPLRWPAVAASVEGSVVWDAVYFVRIAQCGYEYEQTYAFFPLLPIFISLFSRSVFAPLIPLIGHRAVLALSGYLLNNVAFVVAAVYFYRLSVIILKDKEAALRATFLFCFNPASIFYSSIYTESLYSLFSIGGMYYLASGADNVAVLFFALSGSARSNGIINAGYICFQTLHKVYDAAFVKKRSFPAVQVLIAGGLRCIVIFAPFLAFQAYGYYNICFGRLTDELSPWCKARPPLLYNYIQSRYWGVGFLKYFQLKQLPNFLLASPILSLAFCSIAYYVKSRPEVILSLGFRDSLLEDEPITNVKLTLDKVPTGGQLSDTSSLDLSQEGRSIRHRKQKLKGKDNVPLTTGKKLSLEPGYFSINVLPYVLHLAFLAFTAFLVMHVQVATRFLSASPSIYWFASYLLLYHDAGNRWGYVIWVYCAAYILLGSLLFSNFYPFT